MDSKTSDAAAAQVAVAPRETVAGIEAKIAIENCFNAGDALAAEGQIVPDAARLLTIYVITMRSGFTVLGKSAVASPENFNADLGRKIAREDAINQLWALEGYLLREQLAAGPDVVAIARSCHEVNRTWCAHLGDDSQPPWDQAPAWQVQSALAGVRFHLDNPEAGASASHDSWMAQKVADGWIYGSVKDATMKEHPCLVPFEDLPADQQVKDKLFRSVVHAAARLA